MNTQKIAILVDSCCDVPEIYVKQYGMYVIPLKIIYQNAEYLDGVDISAQEVYRGLSKEVPKTSLPSGEDIQKIFDCIKQDGYEKIIAITLSSGLSGTNNMVHLIAEENKDIETYIFDTKNISIGGGFHAIQAGRYLQEGMSFKEVQKKLEDGVKKCKIFFVVETLEYLQKGGRIGLVASLFGNALNLKPIISCNEDGIYYTVAKVRGRKQSLSKTKELALAFAQGHKNYNISIVNGDAQDISNEMKASITPQLPHMDLYVEKQCSPALGVHTGPGTIGICVQVLED